MTEASRYDIGTFLCAFYLSKQAVISWRNESLSVKCSTKFSTKVNLLMRTIGTN